MSTAAIELKAIQTALPARLRPWLENPYRLVSLWDMLIFDAGRLARAMQFLAENHRLLEAEPYASGMFWNLTLKDFYVRSINELIEYCVEAQFPMTKVPLERIIRLTETPQTFPVGAFVMLLNDAMQRLRDESEIHKLLELSYDESRLYKSPMAGWEEIAVAFPDTSDDIEEMNKCFALTRYTASVFHSLMVVEGGLIALGKRLGVSDPKEGWDATCKKMELILKAGHLADASGLEFAFIEQTNAAAQVMKHAWRNKVSHAAGRLTVMKTGFLDYIAEDIIHATRSFMRIIAEGCASRAPAV